MSTVTLLIPIYNVERYIAQCAESLFAQTYPDIRYVFINDCTPDRSLEVLGEVMERFPQRKNEVTILHNETNSGIGAVRERMIKVVDTEFLFMVDSDDLLPLDAIEKMMKKMEASDADVIDGAYAEYYSGQLSAPRLPYHGDDSSHRKKILCQNIASNRVWGRLFRTKAMKGLEHPFVKGIDYSEDFGCMGRLVDTIRREYTDDIVYYYRTDNMSSYTKQPSRRNLLSYISSNEMVRKYYTGKYNGKQSLPLEIGLLNAYREPLRSGLECQEIDAILHFRPQHAITRMLYDMLRSRRCDRLADFLYKATRRLASI